MTGRLHRSIRYISGTFAALSFGLASTSVLASDPDSSACDKIGEAPQGVEVPAPSLETPSLQVKLVDYGTTDSASDDMKAPAADPADAAGPDSPSGPLRDRGSDTRQRIRPCA